MVFSSALSRSSCIRLFFFLLMCPPLRSTLFPYTTLFRSCPPHHGTPESWSRHLQCGPAPAVQSGSSRDRKSTRLNSSHVSSSYAVFCLKKKKNPDREDGSPKLAEGSHTQHARLVSQVSSG